MITEETLAFRRWVERFASATQKLGQFHDRGTVRSTVGEDRMQIIDLACECGATLGPWRDI